MSDNVLSLSAAQREIWFAEQRLNTANRVYKVGECVEIYGPVDPVLFEAALRRVVGEVDSLHVRFVEDSDGPRQVVEPSSEWLMPVVDVSEESDPHMAAGIVAHAVATELQQRGKQVALLAVLDTYPVCGQLSHEDAPELDERDMLIGMLDALDYDVKSLKGDTLTFAQAVEIFRRSQERVWENFEEYHLSAVTKILANSFHIMIDFTPSRFHGDLLLFTSTIHEPTIYQPKTPQPEDAPTPEAWKRYVEGAIKTHAIVSRHDRMMQSGALAQIGPILAAKLEEIADTVTHHY